MKNKNKKTQSGRPHILVVSNNYPSRYRPNRGAFVYNLVQQFADKYDVTVIAPLKINEVLLTRVKEYGNEKCKVYRPIYPSVSNKIIFGINFKKISFFLQKLAVVFTLKIFVKKPIAVTYSHFIVNGLTVFRYAEKRKIPMILASGESSYSQVKGISSSFLLEYYKSLRTIVCVSEANRNFFLEHNVNDNKLVVVPNAVNYNLFKPVKDKDLAKRLLGISSQSFVVGFVGHFIERKGPNRVIQAVELLADSDIVVVCVGNGPQKLLGKDFVIEKAPVSNVELPNIMNAFDVFVLPTLSEGHCNVIEEAKACCIPVVSSLGTTVETQINDQTGILIDPLNINDIARAVSELKYNHEKRENIIANLVSERGRFSIEARAEKIMNYFY